MSAVARLWPALLAASALALTGCPDSDSPSTPLAPPETPTGLTATAMDGAVTLSWTPAARATSYNVYQSDVSGLEPAAMTRSGDSIGGTEFNAAAPNDAVTYFRVTAVNGAGETAGSSEVYATPSSANPPATPVHVTATAGHQSVTLTWDSVPGATSYTVRRSLTAGVTMSSTSFTNAPHPFQDNGLINGTAYYYAVTALIGAKESALSREVTATPRALPYIDAEAVMTHPSQGFGTYSVKVCTERYCATPIVNATVRMGGKALAYDAQDEEYKGAPSSSIAGKTIEVVVTIPPGGQVASGTYSASGTMYTSGPGLLSPTSGSIWLAAADNVLTWSHGAPTAGSTYLAAVFGMSFYVAPIAVNTAVTNQTHTVPAGSLFPGTNYAVIALAPAGGGIAIPNAGSGSSLSLAAVSQVVTFKVQ